MGAHDVCGKLVMRQAAGSAFQEYGPVVNVLYGARGGATIDGVVGNSVAVEIESRVSKQVRGAVLDLICQPYPKKLLVLLPVHMSNPVLCSAQCESILARFIKPEHFRVVVLSGSGLSDALEGDVTLIQAALSELQGTSVAV
jgi:hypothetical protein